MDDGSKLPHDETHKYISDDSEEAEEVSQDEERAAASTPYGDDEGAA